jgi:hypothetical protein
MKVVINQCFGGFGLSQKAFVMLLERKGVEFEVVSTSRFGMLSEEYYEKGHAGDDNYYISDYDFYDDRSDEDLVEIVELLKEEANGWAAELKVVEIPDGVEWYINEYDGIEHVAEKHRTWS